MRIDWTRVDWFAPSEFRFDPSKVAPELVYALDEIRARADLPIYVHHAWALDGHAEGSYHYTGQAVDFRFEPGLSTIEEFLNIVQQPEIGGIGFYPDWKPRLGWHVDLRSSRLFWTRIEGSYYYDLLTFSRVLRFPYDYLT